MCDCHLAGRQSCWDYCRNFHVHLFVCLLCLSSGDETRSVVSTFAALGSLTLCSGSGWRREALSSTTTSCRTSSSVSQRSQRGWCHSAFCRYMLKAAIWIETCYDICISASCCVCTNSCIVKTLQKIFMIRTSIPINHSPFCLRTTITWISAAICWLRRVTDTCMVISIPVQRRGG